MNLFPQAIPPPEAKRVIHRFPRRQIVRKQAPRASASEDLEDGVENFTSAVKPGTPMDSRSREKRSDAGPFRVA